MRPRLAAREMRRPRTRRERPRRTVFACATCLYAWRSTEPEENTNPDKYPAAFRLKPEQLADLAVIPTIPPLRSPSAK